MTSAEFRDGIAEMARHLFELDDVSRGILDQLFEMLKGVWNPGARRDWYVWIRHDGQWHYINAYLPLGGKIVCVDHYVVVKERMEKGPEDAASYDAAAVLTELTEAVRGSVEKAGKGEYADWVGQNLPISCRTGRISLNSVSLESRMLMAGEGTTLTDREKEEFLSYREQGYKIFGRQINFTDMTACLYYNMYACVAKECGLEGADTLSDRELFFQYYAGDSERDLKDMDENDAYAFTRWYDGRRRGGNVYYTFCGNRGLPAAIELCQDEAGYFLKLYSAFPEGNAQVVRFYNALVRAGFPVYVEFPEELLDWVNGNYTIGVEPRMVMERLGSLLSNNYIHAFTEYESLPNDELKKAVGWQKERDLLPVEGML